jgi:hypothetical protein
MNQPPTVFPPGVVKTDKTEKTYSVGNDEFLLAVFGGELAAALPLLVSFKGNPEIRRHAGRIVDGRRFVRVSGNRSAEAWQVEVVESVLPVLPVSMPSIEKSVDAAIDKSKVHVRANPGTQLSLFG